MLKIISLKTEDLNGDCVTDNALPRFAFALESDGKNVALKRAVFECNGAVWETDSFSSEYRGEKLRPFSRYGVKVTAYDDRGESASAETSFATGRMETPWTGKWISDPDYIFNEKRVSPVPMEFRRRLTFKTKPKRVCAYVTALGIFEMSVNGVKAGEDYFAPGFTSYKHTLHYMSYDVTELIGESTEVRVVVAGGWAVGSFVFTRKNRITAPRQALLCEIRAEYADGKVETIGTDESWQVTENGRYRAADFYDGESYDATVGDDDIEWRNAAIEKVRVRPKITACDGAPVRVYKEMTPKLIAVCDDGELVYDFAQNFAGVIRARIKGAKRGTTLTFRHAEVLKNDGSLNTDLLRSAKATATYVCAGGEEEYSPRLTYMGFRYVGVSGADANELELTAYALSSFIEQTGSFSCSDELLNRLQSNIFWSARSNFMDIPTDCPQRDERMGWTGDIALFAQTACCNFDMSRFLKKWLRDVRDEQLRSGGIPNTVPVQGYGFPATMPVMAVDFWGDACVLVPWALYRASGDVGILKAMYATMKKYVKACKFWAGLLSFGKKRYIWHTPAVLHFGDWLAPDLPKMSQWQARSRWTATASLANTSGLLAKIAGLLGNKKDEKYYSELSARVADAYVSVFTDGNGKLKNEFQTGYVLPLYFGMFPESVRKAAADNLERLVRENGYRIGTGFPGTPYILFALADNGHADAAFKLLTNKRCPGWLHEVISGGTTIWERWDAAGEGGGNTGGDDGTGGMVSFNHYASGAVGDFFYRRILGIEPTSGGYATFDVRPLVGGGLTYASGEIGTPYGKVRTAWTAKDGKFSVTVSVPVGTRCRLVMPSLVSHELGSGDYTFAEAL